jgi:DNA repair exonuclease SbcCD ATPase subunit
MKEYSDKNSDVETEPACLQEGGPTQLRKAQKTFIIATINTLREAGGDIQKLSDLSLQVNTESPYECRAFGLFIHHAIQEAKNKIQESEARYEDAVQEYNELIMRENNFMGILQVMDQDEQQAQRDLGEIAEALHALHERFPSVVSTILLEANPRRKITWTEWAKAYQCIIC